MYVDFHCLPMRYIGSHSLPITAVSTAHLETKPNDARAGTVFPALDLIDD